MIEVFGARVRQARVYRRMTATSLAETMGWTSVRQTKVEKATSLRFTEDEVAAFASLLRFPAAFFSSEPQTRVSAAELLFRAPKAMTKGEQEFMAAFASMAGDFLAGLGDQSILPSARIPSIEGGVGPVPIALAAAQLRQVMGLEPHDPFDDLMYEVERRLGAPIIVRRRSGDSTSENINPSGRAEKHLGYSTWVGRHQDRPLMVLRESDSWERTRFTVSHELGHLVMHSRLSCSVGAAQEEEANRFAAELLAPVSAIAAEVPVVVSLLNLKPMKDKWGISLGSLIRHLRDSQLIDVKRAKMLTAQLHSRHVRTARLVIPGV